MCLQLPSLAFHSNDTNEPSISLPGFKGEVLALVDQPGGPGKAEDLRRMPPGVDSLPTPQLSAPGQFTTQGKTSPGKPGLQASGYQTRGQQPLSSAQTVSTLSVPAGPEGTPVNRSVCLCVGSHLQK